jgi:hypothetical protein
VKMIKKLQFQKRDLQNLNDLLKVLFFDLLV